MRSPRKFVPVSKNVQTMYEPIKAERLTKADKIEILIEETESDIYRLVGDNPTPELLASPAVVRLNDRLVELLRKKDNAARIIKERKRHRREAK